MKKRSGLIKFIYIILCFITTITCVSVCLNDRNITQHYIVNMKIIFVIIWYICYLICFIHAIKDVSNKGVKIFVGVTYSVFYTVQTIVLFNLLNFIEIQHYFLWKYNISFYEIIYRNVAYDIINAKFGYLALLLIMFIGCLIYCICAEKTYKKEENYEKVSSFKMPELKISEKEYKKADFRQKPSKAKLRSKKRAEKRKNH